MPHTIQIAVLCKPQYVHWKPLEIKAIASASYGIPSVTYSKSAIKDLINQNSVVFMPGFIESKFYPVIAHYLVYKPALDLQEIPLFYMLLHSSSPQVSINGDYKDISNK